MFTGQWYDEEIGQYYLRARQYDPAIYRFTSRDPEKGKFTEPLSLHRYLYCQSDPANYADPSGRNAWTIIAGAFVGALTNGVEAYSNPNMSTRDKWLAIGLGAITGGIGASGGIGTAVGMSGMNAFGMSMLLDEDMVDGMSRLIASIPGSILGYGVGKLVGHVGGFSADKWDGVCGIVAFVAGESTGLAASQQVKDFLGDPFRPFQNRQLETDS